MNLIRSTLFALVLLVITPPYSLLVLCCAPLPRHARHRVITGWSRIVMLLIPSLLGIRYRVEGLENIPKEPMIILAKHQSAWETIAFQSIFPPQVQVLKRELLWIPFFGWGLALMSPIAIDRSRGSTALKRMAEQGRERLAQGFCIIIFPEGTRTKPGERRRYRFGGGWLANHLGAKVLPVAHNAGLVWPRNAFVKRPGVITVRIGEPIDASGLTADEVNRRVEEWIEKQMEELCPR